MNELDDLLASLPGYALLSAGMKQSALAGSLVPDADGNWPGTADYVETHDTYYAAIKLVPLMQAQSQVTDASSEGTSVKATPFDWSAILRFYHDMSRVMADNNKGILRIVPIPSSPHVYKTDMSGRGTHYGDVNTDLG